MKEVKLSNNKENNDIVRFLNVIEDFPISITDLTKTLGVKEASIKVMLSKKAKVTPKWVTTFLLAYDLGKSENVFDILDKYEKNKEKEMRNM